MAVTLSERNRKLGPLAPGLLLRVLSTTVSLLVLVSMSVSGGG
jgi:hypothetical protein